jgi:hypothetical protein
MRRGRYTDRPLRAQRSVRASARLGPSEHASADRHHEAVEPCRSPQEVSRLASAKDQKKILFGSSDSCRIYLPRDEYEVAPAARLQAVMKRADDQGFAPFFPTLACLQIVDGLENLTLRNYTRRRTGGCRPTNIGRLHSLGILRSCHQAVGYRSNGNGSTSRRAPVSLRFSTDSSKLLRKRPHLLIQ